MIMIKIVIGLVTMILVMMNHVMARLISITGLRA